MHRYHVTVEWTGNTGEGTSTYRSYQRQHVVTAPGAPPIPGSSDQAFRGDAARWNPEQLIVASQSQCHMLWYLHVCAEAGVIVDGYVDDAEGTMELEPSGSGRFTGTVLRPRVVVRAAAMIDVAQQAHHRAHEMCFIANSVNFPVRIDGTVTADPGITPTNP
jgi:organic hydroperoxide reductase OsmC/OhrA